MKIEELVKKYWKQIEVWLKSQQQGSTYYGSMEFPSRGVSCLFIPNSSGNKTTWDPLDPGRQGMWSWLKKLNCNTVAMLCCLPGSRRFYTEDEFRKIAIKCRDAGVFPLWTIYTDSASGQLDPKLWKQNFAGVTQKILNFLDKEKIPGAVIFSIESNESGADVSSWAAMARQVSPKRIFGAHMEFTRPVPRGIDLILVETNQPMGGRGDKVSVEQLIAKANACIAQAKAAGVKYIMIHEYNDHVEGAHYFKQREALSKLNIWGYAKLEDSDGQSVA